VEEKLSHVVKQDGDYDNIEVYDLGAFKHVKGTDEETKDYGQALPKDSVLS
jgi:hypothetical protein